jgi:hypothetical protein
MSDGRKVGKVLARQRRKLARAKALIAAGCLKKDAAIRVGWSISHLRALLHEDRSDAELLK